MSDDGLKRELGVFDASMLGLGSIVGTGVFVSIGIAAGVAGADVIIAIILAAAVATCNALSSAQLAASHPVSGGTYEYGYRYLAPWLGFAAGWMFLCAKTASAATAALGFSGYLLNQFDVDSRFSVIVAVVVVLVLTGVVLAGIKPSSRVNNVIVSTSMVALLVFVVAGAGSITPENLQLNFAPPPLLEATALMFVAYTGYGRIATLGEEVHEPQTTIPRAIIITLVCSAAIYVLVAIVAIGAVGGDALGRAAVETGAPLEFAAEKFRLPVGGLVALGALAAMLGVLLNLLLGLSRVVIAMGRRGDMPSRLANVHWAIIATGLAIAGLAATGSIKTAWSLSAFTVLVYYAVTNLAALKLPRSQRLYSQAWAYCGLSACLWLAFALEASTWTAGLLILAVGLVWHGVRIWIARQDKRSSQR